MPFWPTALLVITIILWVISPATAKKGVGVAGPDQLFTITQGSNLTSYARVYNTGDEPSVYLLNVSGNITQLMMIEKEEVSIDPDKSTKVDILYVVSTTQTPGEYTGNLLISVKGPQVSPGVSKNIRVNVIKSTPNQKPVVSFISPDPGTISGSVEVSVEASDPDQNSLDVSILIDGAVVASTSTYQWDTTQVKNGDYALRAEANDGMDSGFAEIKVRVRNPYNFGPEVWIAIPLVLFTLVLIVGALVGSSKSRVRGGKRK